MKRKMLELVDKIKKKGNGKKVNQFQNSSNMWRFFTIFVLLINFFGVCMAEPAIQNANVLKELGLDIENEAPEHTVTAVQGNSVDMPCNVTPPSRGDSIQLVLWFKNDDPKPIYSYDKRGKSHEEAKHWAESKVLNGRAFFRGDYEPGRLILDNVQPSDRAIYKCRVDYLKAPTTISNVNLDIIIPPEKPRIFSDSGKEVRLKLGPYRMGDTLRLRCETYGGNPKAKVTWWRDHALLDDSDSSEGHKVINELILHDLKRTDLNTIFTCQASNNNMSVPVSTSVKLDMECKAKNDKISTSQPFSEL